MEKLDTWNDREVTPDFLSKLADRLAALSDVEL